jgi:hypothetical protein
VPITASEAIDWVRERVEDPDLFYIHERARKTARELGYTPDDIVDALLEGTWRNSSVEPHDKRPGIFVLIATIECACPTIEDFTDRLYVKITLEERAWLLSFKQDGSPS